MNEEDLLVRLSKTKERIIDAASRAGRDPASIKLIAVSKNHSTDKIEFLHKKGIKYFGENRVQELMSKNEDLTEINWHFIGHLQRNKVKYLTRMDNCKMIQSLDSWRLAKEVNKRARKNNRVIPVLVEVNTAGDENKYGFKPAETLPFIKKAQNLDFIQIQGLMTIAPYVEDSEEVRPYFKQLADLRKNINQEGFQLSELSMGMTNDFEVAIEEGATIVRIGTGLFGEREY